MSKLFKVTITDIDDNVRWGHTAKYSQEFLDLNPSKTDPMLALEALDFLRRDIMKMYGVREEDLTGNKTTTAVAAQAYKSDDEIERVEVQSSNVMEIAYTTGGGMVVQFKNGTEYLYEGVPRDVYEDMKKSESVGKFLNQVIKGQYKYRKLEDQGE